MCAVALALRHQLALRHFPHLIAQGLRRTILQPLGAEPSRS